MKGQLEKELSESSFHNRKIIVGAKNSTSNEALEKANAEIEHYLGGDTGLKLNDPLWLNKTDVKPMSFDVNSDDWRIGLLR